MTLHFEWDDEKAKRNQQKHLVRFDDPQFITFLDEEHSSDEERYITIGQSNQNRLLIVAHTVAHTERDENIRLISARKVTKHEEEFYQSAG